MNDRFGPVFGVSRGLQLEPLPVHVITGDGQERFEFDGREFIDTLSDALLAKLVLVEEGAGPTANHLVKLYARTHPCCEQLNRLMEYSDMMLLQQSLQAFVNPALVRRLCGREHLFTDA